MMKEEVIVKEFFGAQVTVGASVRFLYFFFIVRCVSMLGLLVVCCVKTPVISVDSGEN